MRCICVVLALCTASLANITFLAHMRHVITKCTLFISTLVLYFNVMLIFKIFVVLLTTSACRCNRFINYTFSQTDNVIQTKKAKITFFISICNVIILSTCFGYCVLLFVLFVFMMIVIIVVVFSLSFV